MSELSPAGFDRSLRLKVTRVGGTPVPHPNPPQPLGTPGREEERRVCCDVGEKRMGSRVRGQRKPYKQQHARSSHHRPPGHTHPWGRPSLPGSASPRASAPGPRPASPVPLLALACSSGPRPPTGQEPLPEAGGPNFTHSNPGAEQEVSGELMLASFPVHPRSCHPCQGQIKRQDLPLSQPAAGWPGLELHVPRCTAPYPHTNTHRFPQA